MRIKLHAICHEVLMENIPFQWILILSKESKFFNFIWRCGMIANETTIHQSSNDVDVNNYKQLLGLQQ